MNESYEHSKIILIHSFKGGTGKSIFAVNIAKQLVSMDSRVLLIESDFSMPAFQSIFQDFNPDIYLNDFLEGNHTDLSNYIYPDTERELGIVFCDERFRAKDKVHGTDQDWFLRKKIQLQKALKNQNYDYIIFDTQPGIHLFIINIITFANHILMMLRPDRQSVKGTNLLLERVYSKSINLSKKQITFNLLINQIPKIEKIEPLITKIYVNFKQNYNFISSVDFAYYQELTSYHIANDEFFLPSDDPIHRTINEYISEHL